MAMNIYPGQIECSSEFLGHNKKKYLVYTCEMFYDYERKRFLVASERGEIIKYIFDFYKNAGEVMVPNEGMPKVSSEMLLIGNCYNNYANITDKTTNAVSVKIGDLERKFLVFGTRRWQMDAAMSWQITPPENFEVMPLIKKNAFGGAKFAMNPLGKGADSEELPNIELASQIIISRSDEPTPAIVDELDALSPLRMKSAGNFDGNWSKFIAPDYPDNLSWEYFNRAMSEQRTKKYFKGDEKYELTNLDPFKPKVEGDLPGIYVRGFYSFMEHPNVLVPGEAFLDTIKFIPDKACISLTWRMTIEVKKEEGADLAYCMFAYENFKDNPRSFEYYQRDFKWRLEQIKADGEFRVDVTSPLIAEGEKSAKVIEYENAMSDFGEKATQYSSEPTPEEKDMEERLKKSENERNQKLNALKQELKDGDNITSTFDRILSNMAKKPSKGDLMDKMVVAEIESRRDAAIKAHKEMVESNSALREFSNEKDTEASAVERKKEKSKVVARKNTDIYKQVDAIDEGGYVEFFGLNQVDKSLAPTDGLSAKLEKVIPNYMTDIKKVYGDDLIVKKTDLITKLNNDFNKEEEIKVMMSTREMTLEQKEKAMKNVEIIYPDPKQQAKKKEEVAKSFDKKVEEIDKKIEEKSIDKSPREQMKETIPDHLKEDQPKKTLLRDSLQAPKITPKQKKELEKAYAQLEPLLNDKSMVDSLFAGYSEDEKGKLLDIIKTTKMSPTAIHKMTTEAAKDLTDFSFKKEYLPIAHNFRNGRPPHEISVDTMGDVMLTQYAINKDLSGGDYACMDLSMLNLSQANFSDCFLEQVSYDRTDLTGCIFGKSIMVRSEFKKTKLEGADFSGANIGGSSFTNVEFKNVRFDKDTVLDGAKFQNCKFDYVSFDETNYSSVYFENCEIDRIEVYKSVFDEISFVSCKIGLLDSNGGTFDRCFFKDIEIKSSKWHKAIFSDTIFEKVAFKNSEFSYIALSNIMVSECDFSENKFLNCGFGHGSFKQCKFVDASIANGSLDSGKFSNCDFTGADLNNSNFSKSIIKHSNFTTANLMGTSFRNAKLKNTDFRFSNLWMADFVKVTIGDCQFTGANTKDTIFDGWKP